LYRSATREILELESIGMPLGVEPENTIDEGTCTLAVGDVVVAFTDGVLDAVSPSGERFGRSRLEQLIREHHQLPSAELAGLVQRSVFEFCAGVPQFDDLTLVVIRAIDTPAL
jgi:sigma-B regulation protein RsbU (phosphoserine phosphatase)